jgi:hypothetical protein
MAVARFVAQVIWRAMCAGCGRSTGDVDMLLKCLNEDLGRWL